MEKNVVFLTLFDLVQGDLELFFLGEAIIALGIINFQTESKKMKDFLIQYCGYFVQYSTKEKN